MPIHQRHGGNAASFPDQIVKLSLIIGDARRHFGLQFLHWQNLDSHINHIADIKRHVLDEQIIGNEGIFAELHFDCDALLYKIRLVAGQKRD